MFRTRLFFYFGLLGVLILIFLSLPDRVSNTFKSLVNQGSIPLLSSSHGFFQRIENAWRSLFELSDLQSENQKLQNELAELRLQVNHLENVSQENERLIRLLHLVESSPWTSLVARVVGRVPGQWNQSLWIDQGQSRGLQEGMAVISAEGIVGKIVEVFPQWSRVMLLTDENCKVGAKVRESGEMGVLEGSLAKADNVLNYLPRDAEAKAGDTVVTSGLSKFFPEGLSIGTVLRVHDDAYGLFQYAEVKPSTNLGKLNEVIVVLSKEKPVSEEGA